MYLLLFVFFVCILHRWTLFSFTSQRFKYKYNEILVSPDLEQVNPHLATGMIYLKVSVKPEGMTADCFK